MALLKFGNGVTQMSGSIGGDTFARNRYGNYVRAKTKPVNPNTQRQSAIRSAMAVLCTLWHNTLSAAQRAAWTTYAQSVGMKNRLGESIFLTGFNMFCRSNSVLEQNGLTRVLNGPAVLALPEKDSTFAIAATADDQKIAITFDNTLPWANEANGHLLIYQGNPINANRNFFNGPWRYLGKIDGNASTPPTTGAELTASIAIATGQKIYCYARVVRADGRLSEPFRCSCTVSAS